MTKHVKVDGAHPLLPTAAIAAMVLRDLARIRKYYPNAIAPDETTKIFERLKSSLEVTVKAIGLAHMLETIPIPSIADSSAEMAFTSMMACIVMHHKDAKLENSESPETVAANQKVIDTCVKDCE